MILLHIRLQFMDIHLLTKRSNPTSTTMNSLLLIYLTSAAIIIFGFLLIKSGITKESMWSKMINIHYVPTEPNVKFLEAAIGVVFVILGIGLLTQAPK